MASILIFVVQLLIAYSAQAAEPVTCDVGLLGELYEGLRQDLCSPRKSRMECLSYNMQNVLQSIPWLMLGVKSGMIPVILSGIQADEAFGELTPQQQMNSNEAKTLHKLDEEKLCSKPEHKYMKLKFDRAVETGNFGVDHALRPSQRGPIEMRKDWCEPIYRANGKVLDFLKLPYDEKQNLLCGNDALRNYYQEMTHSLRQMMREESKLKSLKCSSGGMSFAVENSESNWDMEFQVAMDASGRVKDYFSYPSNLEEKPEYQSWKKRMTAKGERIPELSERYVAPGRFHFKFAEGPKNMAKLASVTYNVGYADRQPTVLASNFMENATSMKHPEIKDAVVSEQFFQTWASEARDCCLQKNAKKQMACIQKIVSADAKDEKPVPAPKDGKKPID